MMREAKLLSLCQRAFGIRGVEIAIGLLSINWRSVAGNVITIICFGGVAYLTQSFGACLLLIGFGLWNYWAGLSDASETFEKEIRKIDPVVSGPMLDAVRGLTPGRAIKVTLMKDKIDFIVIEASDFEHIVDMAGMVAHVKEEKRDGN